MKVLSRTRNSEIGKLPLGRPSQLCNPPLRFTLCVPPRLVSRVSDAPSLEAYCRRIHDVEAGETQTVVSQAKDQSTSRASVRTTLPSVTPNPFTWRRFANVQLGDCLLGEDTITHAALGFCGETTAVVCPTCGELLGNVPVELLGEEFGDMTTFHITPVLSSHQAKHHASHRKHRITSDEKSTAASRYLLSANRRPISGEVAFLSAASLTCVRRATQ